MVDMSKLEFYCCDCEMLFESEPDGTGYEQANCPQCKQISMTAEFEGMSTKKESKKERFVVVAEFYDEASAEPTINKLDEAGIELQVNLPDIVDGDFFTGGNDNVCILVAADMADVARQVIDSDEEE